MESGNNMNSAGFTRSSTVVNPSPWLLIGTTAFCFITMVCVVPSLVSRRRKQLSKTDPNDHQGPSLQKVLAWDDETSSILHLVAPYTLSSISGQLSSTCALILVAQFIGSKEVAAYALVHILVDLSDGLLMGPIYACITLSSHALGAENYMLSAQYLQLAVTLYIGLNIPVLYFWYNYMYKIILWLHWGDEETATLAEHFVQCLIWAIPFTGVTKSILVIWSITGHAFARSVLEVARDGGTVVVLILLFLNLQDHQVTLPLVGTVYSVVDLLFLIIAWLWSSALGWLQKFDRGLFHSLAIVSNFDALELLLATALPLSVGELLAHAEWAVMTYFASFMGPAEVAAWAILGNIWELFYYICEGVGEAAEIRISVHLGNNHPCLAQLSCYKSLLIGLGFAFSVSILFFSLKDVIPSWFTGDLTLQQLLAELIPFVGVANLTMMFGMNCWFILGAQGRYGLATSVMATCSWTICVPLGAFFVFLCHFDLQGMTASLTIGYVTSGAVLSYVAMVTDWPAVALQISSDNEEQGGADNDASKAVVASETSPLVAAAV